MGNPSPVVDAETGDIHVVFSRDNLQAFIASSEDDGCSWSPPREITLTVQPWTLKSF
jgi:sialidase-1